MEYANGGELFDYIVQRAESPIGPMTENEVKHVAKQVFYALSYLHQKQIVHRDIKPENILIEGSHNNKITIKLTDFGFATYFNNRD